MGFWPLDMPFFTCFPSLVVFLSGSAAGWAWDQGEQVLCEGGGGDAGVHADHHVLSLESGVRTASLPPSIHLSASVGYNTTTWQLLLYCSTQYHNLQHWCVRRWGSPIPAPNLPPFSPSPSLIPSWVAFCFFVCAEL